MSRRETTKTQTFRRWIVEGSNGQVLLGPCSLEDALKAVEHHESMIYQPYSASGPMPEAMAEGQKNSRLGYLLRKVNVQVVETYE